MFLPGGNFKVLLWNSPHFLFLLSCTGMSVFRWRCCVSASEWLWSEATLHDLCGIYSTDVRSVLLCWVMGRKWQVCRQIACNALPAAPCTRASPLASLCSSSLTWKWRQYDLCCWVIVGLSKELMPTLGTESLATGVLFVFRCFGLLTQNLSVVPHVYSFSYTVVNVVLFKIALLFLLSVSCIHRTTVSHTVLECSLED